MNTRYPLMTLACLAAAGCADKSATRPAAQPTMRDRQDAALRDPFSYGPTLDGEAAAARENSTGGKSPSISGGSLSTYDPDAMKHDMDSVLNP